MTQPFQCYPSATKRPRRLLVVEAHPRDEAKLSGGGGGGGGSQGAGKRKRWLVQLQEMCQLCCCTPEVSAVVKIAKMVPRKWRAGAVSTRMLGVPEYNAGDAGEEPPDL